jgi:hypothetical protein
MAFLEQEMTELQKGNKFGSVSAKQQCWFLRSLNLENARLGKHVFG